jgi:hypothetical protein
MRSAEHVTRDVVALGAITGIRMFAGPNVAAQRDAHHALVRRAATALALWEVFADKALPLPARTTAPSLLGRMACAALTGWFVTRRARYAALAAASAAAAAYVVVPVRRAAAAVLPDLLVGLIEDGVVLATELTTA